jgi:uncharacterized protein YecT (DUF1311 family)
MPCVVADTVRWIFRIALSMMLGIGMRSSAENPLPKDWEPDLEAAFKMLQDELDDAPQQGMNLITGRMLEIRDAELALVYLKLWTQLPAKAQEKLKAEQARWLATRERKSAEAAESEEGGSLAPTTANLAAIKLTEQRIAELRKRLAASAPKTK